MKSIQTKIILLILTAVVVSAAIIGGIGIVSFQSAMDGDAVEIMNLTCSEKAEELNNILGRIEQSVEILSVYATDNLESTDKLKNDLVYLEKYTEELAEIGLTTANETEGTVAVYIRFNPYITNSTAGFFKVKDFRSNSFKDTELTDLAQYSPDDVEHVGWYYIPVQAGKAVWLQPYYNSNIDIYMISYVIPIYKGEELIGIVGMDIDFDYITGVSDSIKVYKTGYAFLMDDNLMIIHDKNYQMGTPITEMGKNFEKIENTSVADKNILYNYSMKEEGNKRAAFRKLENDMYLGVTAPTAEIDSTKNALVMKIVTVTFFIIFIFVLITAAMVRTIVRPLKALNIAAKEIAGGNLDVSLSCKSKDEVGALSESLRETVNQLRIRINYINNLAYIDKLTGIKNNTAYLYEVAAVQEDMEREPIDFTVSVVDINGLKVVNDTYGHDYGNQLIMSVSKLLAEVFDYENVYRIGGDEFAVIKRTDGRTEYGELELEFQEALKSQTGEIRPSAAIGSASYDKNIDSSYENVFKRADEAMYRRKEQMKAQGESSAVYKNGKEG